MITWEDIIDDIRSEIGTLAVDGTANVTTRIYLAMASRAVRLLQKETGRVRRKLDLDFAEFNDEGVCEIDDDIDVLSSAEILREGSQSTIKIYPTTYENLVNKKRTGEINQNCLYIAQAYRNFYIYPTSAFTGTLQLNYIPLLLPFSPKRGLISGDWSGCTKDTIKTWITSHGPEPDFLSELEGIEAFTAYKVARRLPGAKQVMAEEIREWRAVWYKTLLDAPSGEVNHSINTPAASFGGDPSY